MAKQTRLATTLTARYFPTSELTDAFYMDGRVTSKTTARSADLTNDKEDRGFFFSVFSPIFSVTTIAQKKTAAKISFWRPSKIFLR